MAPNELGSRRFVANCVGAWSRAWRVAPGFTSSLVGNDVLNLLWMTGLWLVLLSSRTYSAPAPPKPLLAPQSPILAPQNRDGAQVRPVDPGMQGSPDQPRGRDGENQQTPEPILRRHFATQDSEEWDKAIAQLRGISDPTEGEWAVDLVVELLTTKPDKALSDYLWVNLLRKDKFPISQRILIALLASGRASESDQRECEERLLRLIREGSPNPGSAADRSVPPLFWATLTHTARPAVFRELFDVLYDHNPVRVIGVSVDRIEAAEVAEPSPSQTSVAEAARRALSRSVGVQFTTAQDYRSWYESRGLSWLASLRELRESYHENQLLELWKTATRQLRDGAGYEKWLLDSIADTQIGAIRSEGLAEIRNHVLNISAQSEEARVTSLKPILERCIDIVTNDASLSLRGLAIEALATMTIFRRDPGLIKLLSQTIDPLRDSSRTSDQYRLGVLAVKAVGELRPEPGDNAVNQSLVRLFDYLKKKTPGRDWVGLNTALSPEERDLLGPLLIALNNPAFAGEIPITDFGALFSATETKELRESIFVIFQSFTTEATRPETRQALLDFYATILANLNPNYLRKAINGIDLLRGDGLGVLKKFVENAGAPVPERREAVRAIAKEVGLEATRILVSLYRRFYGGAEKELAEEIRRAVIRVVVGDQQFDCLTLLLFQEDGEPYPWSKSILEQPKVVELLNAQSGNWGGEELKLVYERWLKIQNLRVEALEVQAQTAKTIVDEIERRKALSELVNHIESTASELELSVPLFADLKAINQAQVRLLTALGRGDYGEAIQHLKSAISLPEQAVAKKNELIRWAVDRLEGTSRPDRLDFYPRLRELLANSSFELEAATSLLIEQNEKQTKPKETVEGDGREETPEDGSFYQLAFPSI